MTHSFSLFGQNQLADSIYSQSPKTATFYEAWLDSYGSGDEVQTLKLIDSSIRYCKIEVPQNYQLRVELEYYKAQVMINNNLIDQSEAFVKQILKEYKDDTRGSKLGEGSFMVLLGAIYYMTQNHEKSIAISRRAIPLIDDYNYLIPAYSSMARSFMQQNETDSTIKYLKKSIDVIETSGDTTSYEYVIMLVSLAGVYSSNNMCERVYSLHERIQERLALYVAQFSLSPRHLGKTYSNISSSYLSCADYRKAIEFSKRANAHLESLKNHNPSFLTYDHLIEAYIKLGDYDSAATVGLKLIPMRQASMVLTTALLPEAEKDIFVDRKRTNLNQVLTILEEDSVSHMGLNIMVLDYWRFLKSFTMRSLGNIQKEVNNSRDTTQIESLNKWLTYRKAYYQKLRYGETDKNTDSNRNVMLSLEKEFYQTLQGHSEFERVPDMSWSELQSSLNEEELGVEFVRYRNIGRTGKWSYGAFLFDHKSKFPEFHFVCTEDSLKKVLSRMQYESEFKYIKRIYDQDSTLYSLIWSEIVQRKPKAKHLYVSMSGMLHGINHSALKSTGNTTLMDHITIDLLNSSGQLVGLPKPPFSFKTSQVSLFGGIQYSLDPGKKAVYVDTTSQFADLPNLRGSDWKPLPHSVVEVDRLYELLQNEVDSVYLFKDINATENALNRISDSTHLDILHISTHGLYLKKGVDNASHALTTTYTKSGLVMAGANTCYELKSNLKDFGDGVLTAPEISSLNLQSTKLVVLSSCESGLGLTNKIGELYGLQRAFKIAGVDYILYSLWKVSDETTMEFMVTFYQNLLKEGDIRQAFARAQMTMREKYSSYHWAAFQLIR
ncbi:MAG: CHAT domain-containing protein [Bacteroidia bacterium]|nr:CHAT domain-containing protein [Bacteroidia bacterium]